MMPGMIMLWYGSIGSIPSGWALCDGTNSTPDLRGVFIRGAGLGPQSPGGTGGSATHTHEFTGDGHAHDLVSGDDIDGETLGGVYAHSTATVPAAGETDSESSLPPYHYLAYIMKLPIS